jgi:hypothetical protein
MGRLTKEARWCLLSRLGVTMKALMNKPISVSAQRGCHMTPQWRRHLAGTGNVEILF